MIIRMVCAVALVATALPGSGAVVAEARAKVEHIGGLGDSAPDAVDVSQAQGFRVYVFENGGVRYVQVNGTDSRVHGAYVLTSDGASVLPLGEMASRFHIGEAEPAHTALRGACPCRATVIHRDPETQVDILALTGSTGEVIAYQALVAR